jgi:DNA-nicking Smr family endonuclease
MSTTEHERKRRRRLTDEEQHLWGRVARSVTPIRRTIPAEDLTTKEQTPRSNSSGALARSPQPRARFHDSAPALAPFDRRTRQKLARGHDAIDARIDLHGMTQAQAHAALRRFLQQAQAEGARFVLVVTGKGRDPMHGVLRRQVPLWLALTEFRSLVVGFDQAHIGHGGEGALYVRMRRGSRTER